MGDILIPMQRQMILLGKNENVAAESIEPLISYKFEGRTASMKLVKLDISKHDTCKVAGLIYETDAETLNFYFKNKENAAARIEKLIKLGNNNIGYERIYVATEDDEQVYGVLVTEIGEEESVKNDFKAYFKTLNLWDAIKFVFLDIGDMLIGVNLNRDDYYLADLAVDEQCRGKGIGTFILEKSLELARERGCKRVVLDVDLENKGALKLYERFGFKIFDKKSIRWFDGEKGVYNMEYRLNEEVRDVKEISDEYMKQKIAETKNYTVVILKATEKIKEPGTEKIIWEHGRRNFQLREEGILSIVCPIRDGSGVTGVGIFSRDPDDVKNIMEEDPGVMAGIFDYEIHPTRSFPGDKLP